MEPVQKITIRSGHHGTAKSSDRLLLLISVLLLSIAPRPARGDDTHYHDYPVGGRAVGLGGAYAALSDDPSGIFFNPAGIVDATRTSVQISTTLYGLEVADSFFSAVGRVADLNTVFTELNVIPSSASFISAIGDLDSKGRPERSYGFGAFVPSYRSLNVRNVSEIETPVVGGCNQLAYKRTLLDRTFYLGAAYGERIDETWRVGLSTFVVYRALRDQEETLCGNPSTASESASFASAQTDLNMGVASLVIALGLKAELGDGWSVGLNVATPSIGVWDGADVRVTRSSADSASGDSHFLLRELNGIQANSKVATSVRAGVAYIAPRLATFVLDATLQAPTRYRLFEIAPEEREVQEALTITSDIERHLVINLNAGAEYLVSRPFSISAGLFTNFSSAPDIPGKIGDRFGESRLPDVSTYGGSFVLGFFSEHTLTRAGITLSYGSGADVVPQTAGLAALGQGTEWVKIELNQLFLFFFLSSTFRY